MTDGAVVFDCLVREFVGVVVDVSGRDVVGVDGTSGDTMICTLVVAKSRVNEVSLGCYCKYSRG